MAEKPVKSSGSEATTVEKPLEAAEPERRIGPYRLLRELGHGGMGTVYLAGRADDEYHKRVAIKVIRGLDSVAIVQHFRRERQILAALEHPNIARLLDGGTTVDGLPYFVMEHVEGERIDRFCDERTLTIRARLLLFQKVCSAVQFAHRNLVVHRDIKPGNILVTREGVPKLMDFGIAKFLNPEIAGEAPTVTALAMTPAYASPEQVRGGVITTATDVYSLGVLLYELLTGHGPYRLKTHETLEVLKAVCEDEPERPSTAVNRTEEQRQPDGTTQEITAESASRTREGTPDRLRRRLHGDLDNIVLMALRKEPQRRYGSVEALSEDIQRYLEGRPVAARKGTLTYRTGKFVGRHWVGVSAAVIVLAAIIGGAALATYGLVRARRAEREALHQAARATAINDFLRQTLFSAQPHLGQGREMKVVDALAAAVPRIDSSFRDQPEIQAGVQHTIGRTYTDLGLLAEAEPLLRQSLATRQRLFGPDHRDVAESLHGLGVLAFEKGDFEAAEALFRKALEMDRRVLGRDALEVAEILNDLGMTLEEGKADYAAAQPLLEESLSIKRARLGERHADVAQSLNNLGMLHYRKRDYAKAEPLLREALALNRELRGSDNADVAAGLNNLGLVLTRQGDSRGAAELLRQALDIDRKVYGPGSAEVAGALNNLAAALQKVGQLDEAEARLRESLGIYKQAFPGGHIQIQTTESLLGGCLTELKRYAEAEALVTSSYAVILKQFGPDHPRTQAARNRVVRLYEAWGKPAKAAMYGAKAPKPN